MTTAARWIQPRCPPDCDTLQRSDGPGSLQNFVGQNASSGVWVFHVANSVEPFTGSVQDFNLLIQPHLPLTSGVTNTIPPHTWVYDSVDVPAGATNLTINATNVTSPMPPAPDLANPPLMVLKFGSEPTLTNADKGPVALTNGTSAGQFAFRRADRRAAHPAGPLLGRHHQSERHDAGCVSSLR